MEQQYVSVDDIKIINEALRHGYDVRIQVTPTGYRILSDRVKVLRKQQVELISKNQIR